MKTEVLNYHKIIPCRVVHYREITHIMFNTYMYITEITDSYISDSSIVTPTSAPRFS